MTLPEPVAWSRLPTSLAGALGEAATRLGVPGREARLVVAALGEVTATVRSLDEVALPAEGDCVFGLDRRAERGVLLIDALAGLGMVAATLGLQPPKILRPLTPIERGIVAATVGAVLRAADDTVRIDLALAPAPGAAGASLGRVQLEVNLACRTFDQNVRLQVPPAWIPRCPPALSTAQAIERRVPLTLRLELGRTVLAAADWARAAVGDGVVFEGMPALSEAAPWPVTVCCGDYAASATWDDAGTVRLSTALRERSVPPPAVPFEPARPHPERIELMPDDEETAAKLTRIGAAPVEVSAELGQLVLRADEVVALQVGSVLPLRRPAIRSTLVELKVADRLWARGEIVEVDGELAVRVSELAAPPSAAGPAQSPLPERGGG